MSGVCNFCGGKNFGAQGKRAHVRCLGCGSLERTRALKLHLDRAAAVKNGDRILHMAPDPSVARFLSQAAGAGYDPVDLFPENFPDVKCRKMDLCRDAEGLAPETYDMVLHSHVLEHLPCNWTMTLLHLHKALKPSGLHIICVPVFSGRYEESLDSLSREEATRRFGQDDHVRRFGREDLQQTLGAIFKGDLSRFELGRCFSAEELDSVNIPEIERHELNSSTVFVFAKSDLRI